jgi:hypothetical protein
MQPSCELPVYRGPLLANWAKEGPGPTIPVWSVDVEYATHHQTFWFSSVDEAARFIADQQTR